MQTLLKNNVTNLKQRSHAFIINGIKSGFVGGLVGTLIMDIALIFVLIIIGRSPWTCFLHVGNTMAAFFKIQVSEFTKIIAYGIATHYVIGPVVGIIFGALAASNKSYLNLSHKKRIAVSAIFIEIISQPLLASTPILLGWDSSKTLLWYGISFFMHFIMGLILGIFVSNGTRKLIGRPEHQAV